MEAAPLSGLNFLLQKDSITVHGERGGVHSMYAHQQPKHFVLCNLHVIQNVKHLPVTVDYSVADRFLPEPCGGSSSKENRKARTEA